MKTKVIGFRDLNQSVAEYILEGWAEKVYFMKRENAYVWQDGTPVGFENDIIPTITAFHRKALIEASLL